MQNQNAQPKSDSISWTAKEFEAHQKTAGWYVGFTVIGSALIIFGFLSQSLLTLILFCLIVVLTFAYAHRRPRIMTHQLTGSGIVLGDTSYHYKEIKKFWIFYNPPVVKNLNIETTAYLNRVITIQLGNQDPVQVKEFLKKYLPEDLDREESVIDSLTRYLRI